MKRYPFLPPDSNLGWTPYGWLVYLSFFFIEPLFYDTAPWEIAASGLIVAAFLPVYFWGFWQHGRRAWWAVFLVALLGAVAAPWNYGAAVFFIYAAGYLGWVGPPRRGLLGIVGLVLWIAVEAWIFDLTWNFWGIGILFSVLIAGINIHYAEVAQRDRALHQSREEVQRLARVAERERIGRDLHDLLGHTLSLITLKAELAGKLLAREAEAGGSGSSGEGEPSPAGREIADIERISRRALAEVRQAVAGFRAGGLAKELDRGRAALDSAGLACESEIDPAALARATADEEVERTLSFVLREAVTNVLRHAEARSCRLVLSLRTAGAVPGTDGAGVPAGPEGSGSRGADEVLQLEVRDDGRGGDDPEGFGLSGMRERLAALGGNLRREGNGGTRLVAVVPVGLPREAGASRAPGDEERRGKERYGKESSEDEAGAVEEGTAAARPTCHSPGASRPVAAPSGRTRLAEGG